MDLHRVFLDRTQHVEEDLLMARFLKRATRYGSATLGRLQPWSTTRAGFGERDPRSFSWLVFSATRVWFEATELLERTVLQFAPRGRQEGGMSEQWWSAVARERVATVTVVGCGKDWEGNVRSQVKERQRQK